MKVPNSSNLGTNQPTFLQLCIGRIVTAQGSLNRIVIKELFQKFKQKRVRIVFCQTLYKII